MIGLPFSQQSRPIHSLHRFWIVSLVLLGLMVPASRVARAGEAAWIWSPAYEKEIVPQGECYFRKTFTMGQVEKGEIQIACDDQYELYVNSHLVGTGKNWKVMDVFDVTKQLVPGENSIAVKAANSEGGTAGLVARVVVKEQGNTAVTHSTDPSWKTSIKSAPQWQKKSFDDRTWLAAQSFGELGPTAPWGNEVVVAGSTGRFRVTPEFRVEWVVDGKETGSLIAMAFDEFGQLIGSREGGPLILIRDENKDGLVESVTTICDEVRSCQGILCVSGKIFVTGQGPKGAGLYRLTDTDHDGKIDQVDLLLPFKGEMAEHGPHGLALGPDGLIYVVIGNFSGLDRQVEPTSPHHHYYEGDLLTPKYEDAGGHATGIKAPGGCIARTDTSGTAVELFAGGFQNAYDLCFNREGELFTGDSDMEWDQGTTWYRPTRLDHVIPGAEFGWRSGWSKWYDYYADNLPPVAELGRGSPTGIEVYNHVMYPTRYHNAAFVCDWSRGRILVVKNKPHGASYKSTIEVFVEGAPLNVTDIAVGPDGWLYFCTGGRDTEGGVYRIVWEGNVPDQVKNLGSGITSALRQPQLNSAWARQQVALIRQQLGSQWGVLLDQAVTNTKVPAPQRLQALDLMQLFGPLPSTELLIAATRDRDVLVRCKAIDLMGLHPDAATNKRLVMLLADPEPRVQQHVCAALARLGYAPKASQLSKLLESSDRAVAWSARRLLQQLPAEEAQEQILETKSVREFLSGSLALLAMDPSVEFCAETLDHAAQLMKGYLSDQDFLDLLRVCEVALMQSNIAGEQVADLRKQFAEEYPSQDLHMNRELATLLAYLQEPEAAQKFMQQLESDLPNVEKVHIATRARFLEVGWTPQLKLDLLQFYEEARLLPGGNSYQGYLENISRDFFANFSETEAERVLAEGHKWPSAALSMLAKLPEDTSPEVLLQVQNLDRQLQNVNTEAAKRLRTGITAVLGSSGDAESMAYLRELYESDLERRVLIAMALAQHPCEENWPVMVRSLSVVEGAAAQEVLAKLTLVDQAPEKPEPYRQAILRGLMLRENGGRAAIDLLEHWTGEVVSKPEDNWDMALAAWQNWFVEHYPYEPAPNLPVENGANQWTYQELLSQLSGAHAVSGNAKSGAGVFEKAQCARCHRFGERGDGVGPDLTNLSRRFQKKEILESILYPSQTISDQYASKVVELRDGRVVTGLVSPLTGGGVSILESSGNRIKINAEDIEMQKRSNTSAMPEGLLNNLTLDEIADLFAYLGHPPEAEFARRAGRIKSK